MDGCVRTRAGEQRQRTKAMLRIFKTESIPAPKCGIGDLSWVWRLLSWPAGLPPPPAQGTFCLNESYWWGGRPPWGVEVPALLSALLAPGGRHRCQRDKSDFFLLLQGQKFRLPRLRWGIAPGSHLRYASPEPWATHLGGMLAVGGLRENPSPCIQGLWKLNNFMSQGRPLLKIHLSALGPEKMVVWAIRGLPGTMQHPEGTGHCAGLGWEWPRRCPFPGALWWLQKTSFVENCFSAWNQTSSRWFGPCPCVGHYHTKRPIKIKKKNYWRWWQMMHLLFAG